MVKRVLERVDSGPSTSKRIRTTQNHEKVIEKAGKVAKISLVNFMCHAKLQLDFNDRMNFILGHNGAGKSVILTAIIIGLGGSAKATNRSSVISKLVKNGESSATIEVHLSNSGPDAYEPNEYGSRIIVTRQIQERGGSSYKIMDENRRVVTKSKTILDIILRYFEITVTNPITILTQDCARTFLRDSDPRGRFQLFRQGVGLAAIEEDIAASEQMRTTIVGHLQRRQDKAEYYDKDYREKQRIFNILENAGKAQLRIKELENELLWIDIREEKKLLAQLDTELSRRQQEVEKYAKKIETILGKGAENDEQIGSLRQEKLTKEAALAEQMVLINGKKNEIQERKNEFFSVRKVLMASKSKVSHIETDIRTVDDNLCALDTQGDKRKQYEDVVAKLKRKATDIDKEATEKEAQIRKLVANISEWESELTQVGQQRRQLGQKVAQCRDELNQIENITDNLAIYGAHMPDLLKCLEQNRRKFSMPPIGPLGKYLEVSNVKYRAIVEQLIGGNVTAFIVNTPNDHSELLKIFESRFPRVQKPVIIQRKFKSDVYDTSRNMCRPPPNMALLLNEIRSNNATVMNTLIDLMRMEQILICDNLKSGYKLTEHSENVPHNLKRVIVMEPLADMYPQPNFRIYMLKPRQCKFIQVSTKEKKEHLLNKLAELEAQLAQVTATYRSIEANVNNAKRERKELGASVQTLSATKIKIDSKVQEICDQHLGPRVEEDTLLEERQSLVDRLEQEKIARDVKQQAFDQLKLELNDQEQALSRFQVTVDEMENEIRAVRGQMEELTEKASQLGNDSAQAKTVIDRLRLEASEQDTECGRLRTRIEEMCGEAGDVVVTRKSKEQVRAIISSLIAQKQKSKDLNTTAEEVAAEMDELRRKIQLLHAENDLGTNTLLLHENALEKHRGSLAERKTVVQGRMRERFVEILSQQNFNGDLNINYAKGLLDLTINPRESGTVRGTKSLSGGERSFSTIAFLLAIWSCIEHPFFLLDEYDVFTDGPNREIMTKLLMREAREKPYNQYMFLTPQDMSHIIEPSDDLSVFRISDRR